MSNFFILVADKPIKSKKLKLNEIQNGFIEKIIGKPNLICYELLPVADVEKTPENEKATEFYNSTSNFFKRLNELCFEQLKQGNFIAFILTYYGQNFKEYEIEEVEFPVNNFLNKYINFEFNTIYRVV